MLWEEELGDTGDTALPLSLQNGGTPLLYAVRGNHVKCVEALLGKGQQQPLGPHSLLPSGGTN